MTFFLLAFFFIYGSIHLYTFLRARTALHLHGGWAALSVIFMLLMLFAPFIVRLLEHRGFELSSRIFSEIGYNWMGLLFLFFVLSILVDLYHSIVLAAGWISVRDLSFLQPSARQIFFIPLIVAAGIFIYAHYEASAIRTERIVIASEKVPARIGTLKIVQISDVHIGLMIREARLKRILEKVNKEQPDLLVSTGDLLDGQTNQIGPMAELIRKIQPKYGKYAIMGNHEYYSGYPQAHQFFKEAGLALLRGEGEKIAGFINLVGFDDPAGRAWGIYRDLTASDLKARFPQENFTLFLKHRPVVEDNPGSFDLQLSGHTHQGQIFPFNFIIRMVFPMYSGFFALPGGGKLYVNRGAGTWGPPIRFLAPPEITVIELKPHAH